MEELQDADFDDDDENQEDREQEEEEEEEELLEASYARSLRLEQRTWALLQSDDPEAFLAHPERQQLHQVNNKSRLVFRLNKFLLEAMGQFCFIDLFAYQHFRSEANRIRWPRPLGWLPGVSKLRLHKLQRSEWYLRHVRARLWPRLVFVLWLASCAHALLFMSRQYEYDFQRFRLKRVQWFNRTHPEMYTELALESEQALQARIASSFERVQRVGSLQRHFSFLPQCICLMLLLVSLVIYVLGALYTRYREPFDFYFIRNFLDRAQEQRNCRRLVRQQARLFVESSRNFTRALMEFSELSLGRKFQDETSGQQQQQQLAGAVEWERRRGPAGGEHKEEEEEQHQLSQDEADHLELQGNEAKEKNKGDLPDSLSCRQLRRMLALGQLAPINQSSLWLAHQLSRCAYLEFACLLLAALMAFAFAALLLALGDLATWRDLLLAGGIFFMWTACTISSLFYASAVMFNCYDQVMLVGQLRRLIRHVVALNNLRFYAVLHVAAAAADDATRRRSRRLSRSQGKQVGGGQLLAKERLRPASQGQATALGRRHSSICPDLDTHHHRRRLLPVLQPAPTSGDPRAALTRSQPPTSRPVDPSLCDELEAKMNNDLLLAVMHYRLFFVRMLTVVRPIGEIALIATLIMFLVPLIGRIHLPYFLLALERRVIVLFSCTVLVPVNLILLGPAYVHRRGLDLYASLNSLLAHAQDISERHSRRGRGDIYDRHLVSLLRKELARHEGIVPRFATRCAGIAFTYPNLVRLNFYFGFLLLSIIADNQASEQELSGSIFEDPFGLF